MKISKPILFIALIVVLVSLLSINISAVNDKNLEKWGYFKKEHDNEGQVKWNENG